MKLLLDAHMVGKRKTGVERYWTNLIANLDVSACSLSLYKQRQGFGQSIYRILVGLHQKARQVKPDVIHANFFGPFIKTAPTVITVHDVCFTSRTIHVPVRTRLAFDLFFRRSLRQADAVICVSRATRRELIEQFPVDPRKTHVVYEGVDPCFSHITSRKKVSSFLREKFALTGPYFLVAGNIEHRKDPLPILSAFSEFSKHNKNCRLVFAGQNTGRNTFFTESDSIRRLGYVSDEELHYLYNGAKALVYHSYCEGFGLPLIEAMRCKTPVIASDIPAFRETAGNAALFFKTTEELLKNLNAIMEDKDTAERYKSRGYQRSAKFSWEKTARETEKVYQHVLAGKKP